MLELDLEGEAATRRLARAVAASLQAGDVLGLEGGLGAGKTTFARGTVHALGVPEQTPVTSPTFALLHRYEGRLSIAHADLYRLGDESELEELGLDELLEDGAVLLVEWGRKFAGVAERTALWIDLEIVSEHGRRARLSSSGPRGDAIIAGIREGLSS